MLQYVPATITFYKGTKDFVVALMNGNTTEAVHAAIRGTRPLLVGAVGVNLGSELSQAVGLPSTIARGLVSSATGATVDYTVSAVTDKPFGIKKDVKDENYCMAVGSALADFGYGATLGDK